MGLEVLDDNFCLCIVKIPEMNWMKLNENALYVH